MYVCMYMYILWDHHEILLGLKNLKIMLIPFLLGRVELYNNNLKLHIFETDFKHIVKIVCCIFHKSTLH